MSQKKTKLDWVLLMPVIIIPIVIYLLKKMKKKGYEINGYFETMLEIKLRLWEGYKTIAYPDSGGKATIGIGHLIKPDEKHLLNRELSKTEIMTLYVSDAMEAKKVLKAVEVPISTNQAIVLISMAFNFGVAKIKASTLVERINKNDPKASEELLRWVYVEKNGVMVKEQGLINRREQEKQLFDKKS